MAAGLNAPPASASPPAVVPRAVIGYRAARSGGDPSSPSLHHVQRALVFLGLLGFAIGWFGGFYGNVVSVPDVQRVGGAAVLLGCAIGYVVLRAIASSTCTVCRIALSLSSAGAVFGASLACAFRFPHRPLADAEMLVIGLVIVAVDVTLFAATRSAMKRPILQSFEK